MLNIQHICGVCCFPFCFFFFFSYNVSQFSVMVFKGQILWLWSVVIWWGWDEDVTESWCAKDLRRTWGFDENEMRIWLWWFDESPVRFDGDAMRIWWHRDEVVPRTQWGFVGDWFKILQHQTVSVGWPNSVPPWGKMNKEMSENCLSVFIRIIQMSE